MPAGTWHAPVRFRREAGCYRTRDFCNYKENS
jgi:hypothetical protein